jgi:hypothetical protein
MRRRFARVVDVALGEWSGWRLFQGACVRELMILRAEHPFYSKRAEQPRSKKESKTGTGSTSIEKNRENVSFKGKFDQKV